MKRTLLIGDFLFAKKYSYGIPIPHLPWLEIPLLPDFRGDGHLIDGPRPKREDIVIFRYPKNEKIHYVKRCVAIGGDEIIYQNKKLLIHFKEGDKYIKQHYKADKIRQINGKLWVENPYKNKYPGIQYEPEGANIFEILLQYISVGEKVDVKPVLIEELGGTTYEIGGNLVNALYTKVPQDSYYMIGDNRDNSNDSRFWGPVPYRLIVGKPWVIYMSFEHRSYEQVLKGNATGGGRDHAGLKRVCGDIPIDSKECEAKWNAQRYKVRWKRVGQFINDLELKEPIQ
jgi:signal peptidase I